MWHKKNGATIFVTLGPVENKFHPFVTNVSIIINQSIGLLCKWINQHIDEKGDFAQLSFVVETGLRVNVWFLSDYMKLWGLTRYNVSKSIFSKPKTTTKLFAHVFFLLWAHSAYWVIPGHTPFPWGNEGAQGIKREYWPEMCWSCNFVNIEFLFVYRRIIKRVTLV